MYFKQFSLEGLACQSYFIGDAGVAAVVDPQRDVDIYLQEAKTREFRITHVIETHVHADHVSGNTELAHRTGARVYMPAGASATFPHAALKDGEELAIGAVRLKALSTPGHTPEHTMLEVTDTTRSKEPWFALTGDFLLVGDLGRPDLLGEAETRALASRLYDTVQKRLTELPDGLEVYPGHGAGSLCGRSMSAKLSSTVGFERRYNQALQIADRDEFVRAITSDLPVQPPNVPYIKRLNREGPPILGDLCPQKLTAARARNLIANGAIAVDTRSFEAFGRGHIRGGLNVQVTEAQFATRLGFVVSPEATILFVARNAAECLRAMRAATRVGLDRHGGFLTPAEAKRLSQAHLAQTSVEQLAARVQRGEAVVLDVREASEVAAGHVAGAVPIPLGQLPRRVAEVPKNMPVAVMCASGNRSSTAASLLLRNGYEDVINVAGGFDAWAAAGLPVEQ